MTAAKSRRALLKQLGLAGAAVSMVDMPGWILPALAQDETMVPFTDIPASFNRAPGATKRTLDLRKITTPLTPTDQFYTVQRYGQPVVDPTTFRLKVTGLVKKPLSLSLDDLKRMPSIDLVAGFECSSNSPRSAQGLSSNGCWTGVRLGQILDRADVESNAQEVVFSGADHGAEDIEWRAQKYRVEQHIGRSLTRKQVSAADPLVVWALNGEPLTKHQGAPVRLLVPGWYGFSNVKWLANIHVQDEGYLGRFQARWYRTLRGETIDGEVKWQETAISRMRVKSVIARVTTNGARCTAHGFALTDGTPVKSVEVKVDEGAWQPATLDPVTARDKYSWKLFTYDWIGATRGPHTLVSRATDVNGISQPAAAELENKKSFLEDNSQFPRTLTIG